MTLYEEVRDGKAPIAVVGLGYVGLPLAAAFGKKVKVIGFDISRERIDMLKENRDPSGELSAEALMSTSISYTCDPARLKEASFIVVTVPTPVDSAQNPDLTPLIKASRTLGENLKKGAIIVFESTVYPGVTEEVCKGLIEQASGMKCGKDFKLGYSPERINPGDKEHTFTKILKIVSAQDQESLDTVARVYELVVEAGVFRAESIRVAEAAKVIENTQRDLNIALMNELSIIFDRLNIDTRSVLEAAGTKWNFLKFSPGLVGGHCIGVDPYYLTHKAKEVGYNPEVILAGRRINDGMGHNVVNKTIKLMIQEGLPIKGETIVVMGLTFKENVSDIRNTRVLDIIRELESYGIRVCVTDACAGPEEVRKEYDIELIPENELPECRVVIVATPHAKYASRTPDDFLKMYKPGRSPIFIDVRRAFGRKAMESAGMIYWGL